MNKDVRRCNDCKDSVYFHKNGTVVLPGDGGTLFCMECAIKCIQASLDAEEEK